MILSPTAARGRATEILAELERLLANRAVVGRPRARQWVFLRACVDALLGRPVAGRFDGFDALPSTNAAQYKFEVEDRLRRHALRPGPAVRFLFSLVHVDELGAHGDDAGEPGTAGGHDWPAVAGYCAVVRDLGADYSAEHVDLPAYLERVVSEAIDAEFRCYQRLPEIEFGELRQWFVEDGPAWREVVTVLERNRVRGWHIRNPLNPSTKRLISVSVVRIAAQEAVVRTREYVYLRWWSEPESKYVYPYREENRQTYILVPDGLGAWRIRENLRPPPRQSAPHRRPTAAAKKTRSPSG